ncbi:kinase-like domain-containing protein [Lasiosphaeria ovina]|uniref:Kinase-like domain-containing protein n=1 Tax=Lasiosphaeria ovina TaxID=92902 RepID=A0AAE0K7F8_9PEZI|nr:kinase-like domain-containing protein [Lasiosphaeria ovina]
MAQNSLCRYTAPYRASSGPIRVSTVNENRTSWKNDPETGMLEATWPREIDMEAARKLAVAHLPADTYSDATIEPFAKGGFHVLFLISSATDPAAPKYLMRIPLPVDPFFKTESEVATMEYVRKHTTFPVPQVVAYASSASNELGYEWILMEKMPGVSVSEFWDETMPFDAKKRLAIDIAGHMKTLLQLRFPLLGNLYFSDIWPQVNHTPVTWQKHDPDRKLSDPDDNLGLDPAFVVGRMVSPSFYSDKRLLLQAHRGPYGTARDLVVARIDLLGQRIRRLTPKPGTEYYCHLDESLAEGGPEVLEAFDELRQVAPRIFGDAEGPEDAKVLWHNDLSANNVLVNPDTFALTGVIDWESAGICSAWDTDQAMPYFLKGIELFQEPPPCGSLTEEEEENLTAIRQDWDQQVLRGIYAEALGDVLFDNSLHSKDEVNLKKTVGGLVEMFDDRWESVIYWLNNEIDREKKVTRRLSRAAKTMTQTKVVKPAKSLRGWS